MSKYDTKPGHNSDDQVSFELDMRTIKKIKELVTEFTPKHPYAANVLIRIQDELHKRGKQFHAKN
jgi:hypothetical protein